MTLERDVLGYDTPKPIDPNKGNRYIRQVTKEKVIRILETFGGRTVLLVNRLSNVAIPVVICGQHYYFRSRDKNNRFIWKRHVKTDLMMNDNHKGMWDCHYYFVDFQEMLRDNLLNFGGDRVMLSGEGLSLLLNPPMKIS